VKRLIRHGEPVASPGGA